MRFHWSPYPDEELDDDAAFTGLCRRADEMGFETVCFGVRNSVADAASLAESAAVSSKVNFRILLDGGSLAATGLVDELRRATRGLKSRLSIQLSPEVASEGFRLASSLLAELRTAVPKSEMPEIHVEGDSTGAAFFAIRHADWLWRSPGPAHQFYADAVPILHFGKEVGTLGSMVARVTREDAMAVPNPCCGLVGSFEEVAGMLQALNRKGISHFTLLGLPERRELPDFAAVRKMLVA